MLKRNRQLITDFHLTFNSEYGKRVKAHLVQHFDMATLQMNPNLQTNKAMYQAGQRSVLLYIYKMLGSNPYEEKSPQATNEGNV